jgi:hypothetical protein
MVGSMVLLLVNFISFNSVIVPALAATLDDGYYFTNQPIHILG